MNKLLLTLVSLAHLVPHPFGISPLGATAMYAGAFGGRRSAWLVPLVPLFIGHLVNGFYDLTVMIFVYAGFALSTFAGRLLTTRRSVRRFSLAVVASAVIFYLVSNFSIWLVGMYPQTTAGLIQCYVNGLPYLAASMTANAAYGLLLFGLHARLEKDQMMPVPT